MYIPKRIEQLIDRRARLAEDLNSADWELTKWIKENNIEAEECDYMTGCEMYCNPWAAAQRIKEAIQAAPEKRGRRHQ